MGRIKPAVLCGGTGTRLWPLSRKSFPKQFSDIVGSESLFQACARRLADAGMESPLVLTNSDFRFIVTEQLLDVGVDPGAILIEPSPRNTAPAVLAAALYAMHDDPDTMVLVVPSDHVISDPKAFGAAVEAGRAAAEAGQIVTFGITPGYPETGYGYLELDAAPDGSGTPIDLKRFVEKPDLKTANDMLESGKCLWNAGIFLFSAKVIVQAYRAHAPDMLTLVQAAIDGAKVDLGFLRLDPGPWEKCGDLSVDYAVMEKVSNLSVVPYSSHWSDLGSWKAVLDESDSDANGVVTRGPATAIECKNVLLRSENDGLELVGIGLENVMVVAMPDAVLVADKDHAQSVGRVVKELKRKGVSQAEEFARDHRPWGYFETLALHERFQVKRIVVKPGGRLSLQSHVHRAEHWVVVEGTAQVTIGDTVKLVSENQSVYVPLGDKHRLENPGKVPVTMIEVQTGSYLGEDDIVRYEDVYSRGQGARG